jgi:hypothetical protein
MKFFNIDYHISVIEDLKWIFKDLGHTIDNYSLTTHNHVFNKPGCANFSFLTQQCDSSIRKITTETCDKFYFDNKNTLLQYDGFITTYPPILALLYEKFNKPIIMHIPIRYEYPYTHSPDLWLNFNLKCQMLIDCGQLIATANNACDKHYFESRVKRNVTHIPSWCEYNYPKWSPLKQQFLFWSGYQPCCSELTQQLHYPYSWHENEKYAGIIHIPYNISTMSIFEHYTSNTPLLFPTKQFLFELFKQHKALSQITWDGYNSNNDQVKSMIELADFYDENWMPYIIFFDSIEKLKNLLQYDYSVTSDKMKVINIRRKHDIYDLWTSVLEKIK